MQDENKSTTTTQEENQSTTTMQENNQTTAALSEANEFKSFSSSVGIILVVVSIFL